MTVQIFIFYLSILTLGNFRLGCQGIIMNINTYICSNSGNETYYLLLASTLRACKSTMFLMIAKIVVKNL